MNIFRDSKLQGGDLNEAKIFPVMDGRKIFGRAIYRDYSEAVKKVVNVDEQFFDPLYLELFARSAQYMQSLSVQNDPNAGRYLDRSLRRAYGFIKNCAPKVMANNGFGYDIDRLCYVLFSAALLHGIGRICQDRKVIHCDDRGQFKSIWYPVCGGLTGDFYKVRAIKSLEDEYIDVLHDVYAHKIMPNMGLAWIMEDARLYILWRKALIDMKQGFGELEIELDLEKLEKDVIEEFQFELDQRSIVPAETLEGEKFLEWLKEQVKNGACLDSSMGLHHVDAGLLVELDVVIAQYIKSQEGRVKSSVVKNQIMALGVLSGASSYQLRQGSTFLGQSTTRDFQGCLIDSDLGLFESGSLGPVSSISSQAQISSGERFFTRISGLAQQFMIGHTSSKK